MDKPFEGYAMLELMGHRQRTGMVREVEMAGAKMLRIDIPVGCDEVGQETTITEYYSAAAIYSVRPCSKGEMRARPQLRFPEMGSYEAVRGILADVETDRDEDDRPE